MWIPFRWLFWLQFNNILTLQGDERMLNTGENDYIKHIDGSHYSKE